MQAQIKAPRGTNDILPIDSYKWQYLEKVAKEIAETFGYKEVRFPTFEETELFQRGVGDTTDIVQKEMYTFTDKGDRSITLRPEGTASVVRLCLEHGLFGGLLPIKVFYIISAFRYEKPKAGRFREFHQFGVETFGSKNPEADIEVIELGDSFIKKLGIKNAMLKINSIGCPECRPKYHAALKEYFGKYKGELCDTCNTRLERNPLRILDCKSPVCKEITAKAPVITDYLCEECKTHFASLKEGLNSAGIEFIVDTGIVRGLDYYTKTVFEFVQKDTGLALLAGGRYDGLVNELDERQNVSGLGFASGIERLINVMEQSGLSFGKEEKDRSIDVYIANIGQKGGTMAADLARKLRGFNIKTEIDIMNRSMKAQMKYADKIGAKYTIVIGDDEVESQNIILKNMQDSSQTNLKASEAAEYIKNML